MSSIEGSSVLVTGGCGFIGSRLALLLLQKGAKRVAVLDSLKYGKRSNLGDSAKRIDVLRFSLGHHDPARLLSLLTGIDFVFHLAAEKHNQSLDDPVGLMRTNIEGTYQLLDAAHRAKVKKVVFASSLYAYGRYSGGPMREDEQLLPDTVYGMSKVAGENLTRFSSKNWSIPYNIARLFFIYGPGQFSGTGYKSVVVRNFERILHGEPPVVYGDGLQSLDYLYVDDAADALTRMMERGADGETFNVASGSATPVAQLTDLMIAVSRASHEKEFGPADWTAGTRRYASIEKIGNRLGWTPTTCLEEGMKNTFEWIRATAK